VVFFCQRRGLLPCLQSPLALAAIGITERREVVCEGRRLDCTFAAHRPITAAAEALKLRQDRNAIFWAAEVGSLLRDFFAYYLRFFLESADDPFLRRHKGNLSAAETTANVKNTYCQYVVSIKHGRALGRHEAWGTRASDGSLRYQKGEHTSMCSIQDPFDQAHDIGSALKKKRQGVFFEEMRRAAGVMAATPAVCLQHEVFCCSCGCGEARLQLQTGDADGGFVRNGSGRPAVPANHVGDTWKRVMESRDLTGFQIRILEHTCGMAPGTVATILGSHHRGTLDNRYVIWRLDNKRVVYKKDLGKAWEVIPAARKRDWATEDLQYHRQQLVEQKQMLGNRLHPSSRL
jgi:hypothetical protein